MMKELLLLWRKEVSADVYLYIKVSRYKSVGRSCSYRRNRNKALVDRNLHQSFKKSSIKYTTPLAFAPSSDDDPDV